MGIEISVVITCYREGDLLGETLESALDQTFPDYEILLVDNNADEKTVDVARRYAEKYPEKIRVVKESEPGISSARNRGIAESRGRYIALLDGDDLMKPDRLEKQYQASLAHPEALLFSSSYEIFVVEDGKKNFFSVQKDIHLDWVEMVFKSQKDPFLRSFYVPLPSTIFFERNKVLDLGGFDTFFDTRPGEDIFFAVNNWSKGKFFHVNEVLLSYRAKARNLKNKLSKSWVQRTERQDRIIRTLYALYGDSYPEIHKSLRKLRAFWLRENSLNYFSCREGKKFGDLLLKRSLLDDPFSLETWKMVVKRSLPERFYPKLFWFDRWESLPSQVNHEFIVRTFGLRGARKESDKNDYKVSCP